MSDQQDSIPPEELPEHESGMRRLLADAAGIPYLALKTLEEARGAVDGAVILEGDDGGQIYAVVRASQVRCSEHALQRLLLALDAKAWRDPTGARIFYEQRPLGAGISGGMGGAKVVEGVWVHKDLLYLQPQIAAVIRGEREEI